MDASGPLFGGVDARRRLDVHCAGATDHGSADAPACPAAQSERSNFRRIDIQIDRPNRIRRAVALVTRHRVDDVIHHVQARCSRIGGQNAHRLCHVIARRSIQPVKSAVTGHRVHRRRSANECAASLGSCRCRSRRELRRRLDPERALSALRSIRPGMPTKMSSPEDRAWSIRDASARRAFRDRHRWHRRYRNSWQRKPVP